jgi:hypothetical protein
MSVHFQIRGAHDWEALGSGVSTDEEPLPGAIGDLRSLYGGTLPRGTYLFIEMQGASSRSGTSRLDGEGKLLA